MKIDPYYQRHKCSAVNLVSWQYKIYADVPWRRGVKRQWGNRQESCAVAREPHDAATVVFGLNFKVRRQHSLQV